MISDASFKIKRNKHASIHTLLAVLGSEGAFISELEGNPFGLPLQRNGALRGNSPTGLSPNMTFAKAKAIRKAPFRYGQV